MSNSMNGLMHYSMNDVMNGMMADLMNFNFIGIIYGNGVSITLCLKRPPQKLFFYAMISA